MHRRNTDGQGWEGEERVRGAVNLSCPSHQTSVPVINRRMRHEGSGDASTKFDAHETFIVFQASFVKFVYIIQCATSDLLPEKYVFLTTFTAVQKQTKVEAIDI